MVSNVSAVFRRAVVFNVEVDTERTYFVSPAGFLVHNTYVRYGSADEAAEAFAKQGLRPRPGHLNNPKRILEAGGPTRAKNLGKFRNYSHKITMVPKDKKVIREWLEKNAKRMTDKGHPDGWEIPLEKLDEFNSLLDGITIGLR